MGETEENKKKYEERLQRRLKILKEQLEAGKVKVPRDSHIVESLKAVRYAPDGSVDLATVDGGVRAMALAVEAVHDREELKRDLPLGEIQRTYFTFLQNSFGDFYKTMLESGLSPHQAGMALSRSPSAVDEVTRHLPDILDAIYEFWRAAGDAAHVHVEDMPSALKGVFGGDLFPSNTENIASKCGLYTDTIVLPDPFIRSKRLFELWKPEDQAYYLVKHALNLLQYRELAIAEADPPIVVILPDIAEIQPDEMEFIQQLGRRDAVAHAGKVFGRHFDSFDELMEFAGTLDSVDRLVSEVADPSRVLFDVEWEGSLKEILERASTDEYADMLQTKNPGIVLASQTVGRMGVSNELLIKARRLRGTPIIDAPTSWQYFVWKLEYDAEHVERETNLPDLHVVRGLQSLAENEMEWLGRVPPAALIEIRKTGAIGEIRAVLSKGVKELSLANPTDFRRTSDQVLNNIQAAFTDHRKKIAELTAKKWKFAGSDIGSWLVVGSLAVTAAATGEPVLGLAAIAGDQLLDPPKLKSIPGSIIKLARESSELKQSPVGMLFRYSKEKP